MGKADFSKIKEALRNEDQRVLRILVRNLSKIGEEARNAAIDTITQAKPYKDQTRHLRGSTGYIVAVDGEVAVMGAFGASDSNPQGVAEGKAYAASLAKSHPKGVVLIIVAGKDYASCVANRGYDVLDSAEIKARELMSKFLNRLESRLAENPADTVSNQ